MKKSSGIVFLLLLFSGMLIVDFSCGKAFKSAAKDGHPDSVQSDTAKYELLVFDVHFENWLMTQGYPIDFYSHSYYKMKNTMYVSSWNANYMSNPTGPFHFYIEYDPNKDYDKELEYRLYYYFKYVEDLYNINIR